MKRKIASSLLIFITAAAIFAGCGKKKDKNQEADRNIPAETEVSETKPEETPAESHLVWPEVTEIHVDTSETAESEPVIPQSEMVTPEEARQIALDFVKLNETDVTIIYESIEDDEGFLKYDIEFADDTTSYDFEIDAMNGDILFYDNNPEY